MKSLTLSRSFASVVAVLLVSPLALAEGEIVLSDSPRQNVASDKAFVVMTAKSGSDYPIATKPQFAFDCSQTNGWTINAKNRVSKVPDLGGGSRYITSVIAEINHSNYKSGGIDLWYNGWQSINAPTLKPADDTIKGPYLDFGKPGSKSCLFFDPSEMVGDVAWNKLTNVGTVIGVYKPFTGSCSDFADYGDQIVGGQLLGGKDFSRHSGYTTTTYGIHSTERILVKNGGPNGNVTCPAAKLGGTLYKDRQVHDVGVAYWSPDWEVVAFNPADATTLETHGVGVGNCHGCDYSRTSGGQAIAELMIFDTVLPEEDVKTLIAYLDKKWLPAKYSGEEGVGRVAALNLSDSDNSPGVGRVATVDVPAGETLTVDQMRGGRASSTKTLPALVKTGSGTLTVNDAADFGGEVKLNAGTLAFAAKPVPTLDQLPAGMTFHLDASDTSTMRVEEDGTVSQWTNLLWETRQVRAYQNTANRRPKFVANGLGEGLNIIDFGSRSEDDQAFFAFNPVPKMGTVFAVIDARIQGGGFLTDHITRYNSWTGRTRLYSELFFANSASGVTARETAEAWVNGRHNDMAAEAYEVPAFQVLGMRLPPSSSSPYYLGARAGDTSSNTADAGGLRLGEFIAYERSLSEEEIRDVSAYLMKKWLGRTAPGYANVSDSDVADLQNVVAAADTVIDVPAGMTKTIAKLTAAGAVVKTGAGRLLIGNGSDLSGGLVVREGSVGRTAGATVAADMPAKDPILHLDAAKANTYYAWPHDGTNFVAAWQSLDGKSGTYTQETSYKRIPFLNTWDALNGLPVIDFGKQVNEWSNSDGAYFRVAPEVRNLRAAYVVYGSQAKGGQIFGAKSGTTYDMSRSTSPTLDTALFSNPCDDFQAGEVYTNGVKIAAGQNNKFKPTGGYQLIEVHPISGMRFNSLASGGTAGYLHGGCRMGEVIVYERPLTAREKVATRNYLLKKWFPESPLSELPDEPEVEPLAGDFGVAANGTWNIAVEADGTTDDRMAVTGTISFGTGATIGLTGLTAFTAEQLQNLKLVIANAGAHEGLDDVTVTGDIDFATDTLPRLVAKTNGDLVIRFGRKGAVLLVR